MQHADAHLAKTPNGVGSAEALYLKGQALEKKTAANAEEGRMNFRTARDDYKQALVLQPAPALDARLHAGVANTSYWLDDYPTAIQEWTKAYDEMDDPSAKSFTLYRIGLCQQRLGQFAQADRTFAIVQQQYSGSDAAHRAHDHQGYRAFTVQLATFANPATADAAVANLRRQGVAATRVANSAGQSVVSVAPFANYAQAEELMNRYAATYPSAIVLP